MNKIAIVGLATALCAAGTYAQGVVTFNAGDPFFSYDAQVYGPNPSNPSVEVQGNTLEQNTLSGLPTTGSVTYGGVLIGGASYAGTTPVSFGDVGAQIYTYGNLFTAELYALSTTTSMAIPPGTTLASLSPVTQYQSTFSTTPSSPGPGWFNQANPTSPDPGIPGTGYIGTPGPSRTGYAYLGNNAAAAVVAWYNGGGQFPTLAAAQAAGVPWGQSGVFEITGLAEPSSVMTQDNNGKPTPPQFGAPFLEGTSDGTNTCLTSFSLTFQSPGFTADQVPEPSTLALALLGATALLSRRRNK